MKEEPGNRPQVVGFGWECLTVRMEIRKRGSGKEKQGRQKRSEKTGPTEYDYRVLVSAMKKKDSDAGVLARPAQTELV